MAEKTVKTPAKSSCAAKSAKKAAPKTATPKAAAPKAVKKQTAKPVAAMQPVSKTLAATVTELQVVSDEQRYRMVSEAAYYYAERSNFKSDPLRDWIEAEKYINDLLSGTK